MGCTDNALFSGILDVAFGQIAPSQQTAFEFGKNDERSQREMRVTPL
jgi:hypothetical protein